MLKKWIDAMIHKLFINNESFDIEDDNITISQIQNRIYVNGKLISSTKDDSVHIRFTGNVTNLNCNTCEVSGNVISLHGNSVKVGGDVGGNIESNSIEVKGNVNGDITANSVKVHGKHTGGINV